MSLPQPTCRLCGQNGVVLHAGVRGAWTLRRCPSAECGLAWLDPAPDAETLARAYRDYYTHAPETDTAGGAQRLYRKLIARTPVGRERQRLAVMYLDTATPGALLEIGCGSGARLAALRARGWQVHGQEIDPQAAAVAREHFGLSVHLGPVSDMTGNFDAVILNHVIEHVPDPVEMLEHCRRLLRDGGTLVVTTPNIASYGHRRFGANWIALDPPRHLHLFTTVALRAAALHAGFNEIATWTTSARAVGIGLGGGRGARAILGALWFQLTAAVHCRFAPDSGEECVLQATK